MDFYYEWLQGPQVKAIVSDGRTVGGVLVQMLAVHAATTIVVDHVTTLKRMQERAQVRSVISFWACPIHLVAELISDAWRSLSIAVRTRNEAGLAYHFAACLGTRARLKNGNEEKNLPLLDVSPDPHLLQRRTESRDLRWLARLGVLVAFLVQDLSVIVLYIRRTQQQVLRDIDETLRINSYPVVTDAEFDNINFQFAVGGFAAGVTSLLLTLTNWSWTYSALGDRTPARSPESRLGGVDFSIPVGFKLSSILIFGFQWRRLQYLIELALATSGLSLLRFGCFLCMATIPAFYALVVGLIPTRILQYKLFSKVSIGGVAMFYSLVGIMSLFGLRLASVVEACFDIAALHACSGLHQTCMPGFAWRDPKENVLWAM